MLASILTTVSSVYPAFLAGALGPELRASIDLSEGFFGFVIGAFFAGSALGSVGLGRLGERLGARRMLSLSLLTTATVTALVAGLVRSGLFLVAALAVAGFANSGSQTAVNKLLSQSIDPKRLGFAMAVKQSGMPGATLLGGLAVPAIALTVGWPYAYAAASCLAVTALFVVLRFAPDDGPGTASTAPTATAPSTRCGCVACGRLHQRHRHSARARVAGRSICWSADANGGDLLGLRRSRRAAFGAPHGLDPRPCGGRGLWCRLVVAGTVQLRRRSSEPRCSSPGHRHHPDRCVRGGVQRPDRDGPSR